MHRSFVLNRQQVDVNELIIDEGSIVCVEGCFHAKQRLNGLHSSTNDTRSQLDACNAICHSCVTMPL